MEEKQKQGFETGYRLVHCSNPKCNQVLYEKSRVYWNHAPRRMVCAKCENEVVFQGTHFNTHMMDQIIYFYSCDTCRAEYFLTVPMYKKYCSNCKVEHYRSRSYHLRAPLPPYDITNSCFPLNENVKVA